DAAARLHRRRPRRPRRDGDRRRPPFRRALGARGGRGSHRPHRGGRRGAGGCRPRVLRPGARRGEEAAGRLVRRSAHVPQGQRRRRRHAHPPRVGRVRGGARGRRRRLRPDVPRHRAAPPRQDPALGVRLLRRGRPRPAGPGAQPVEHRPLRRRLLGRVRRPGGRRRRTHRPRQRRRRLDPHPGVGQRPRGAQAHAGTPGTGPDHARDARPDRLRRRAHPQRPRHRRVLPGGGEGLAQPTPRPGRRRHPPGPRPAAGRRGDQGDRPGGQPGGAQADAAHRGPPGVPGPPRGGGRAAGAAVVPRPLRPLLVDARPGDHAPGAQGPRADVGPHQARQPHPGARPPRRSLAAPAAALDRRPPGVAAYRGPPPRDVRRHAVADAGDRDPSRRRAATRPRIRGDPRAAHGLGGLHPARQRDGRAVDLAAARDHRERPPAGHDAGRRSGPGGPAAAARARARGGGGMASDPGRL
ncbi:MAG: Putative amidase amiC, partial [uncultured Nocardioides sp.]